MPCSKCESKIRSLATPEVSLNRNPRQIGGNKLIDVRANRKFSDGSNQLCKTCKSPLRINGKYCPSWYEYTHISAYKEGKCNICGNKLIDVKNYNMSMV